MELSTDLRENVIVRKKLRGWGRYILGIPLTGFGCLLLYGAVSAPILALQSDDWSELPGDVVGAFMLLVFSALTLPIGWWLLLSRHWLAIDMGAREIVEVSDWRLGRKSSRTALDLFRAVRLAREELDASTDNQSGPAIDIQMTRLLAKDPGKTPSLEIGWFDAEDREAALSFAEEIARVVNLPLEVVDDQEAAPSPWEEENAKEIESEA